MMDYLPLLVFLFASSLALKPGSNIYPNEYCLRDGQYLPHPHSPCRYLRCGRLPSGMDIDDDLRKVLFSAEYRCPMGYSVRADIFKKERNGHISDICTAKNPRCLKDDLDIPGATQAPTSAPRPPPRRTNRKYNRKLSRLKGYIPNRKYSHERQQIAHSQNALQKNGVRQSSSPKQRMVKFGRGHQVTNDLVIPRQIAKLHPWLVQNESSVPYVAGPPVPMRPLTTALPLTTTGEPHIPRYRRKHRRYHRTHKKRIQGKKAILPVPLYPPGYRPKPSSQEIQSDYSAALERRATEKPVARVYSQKYITKSQPNLDSQEQFEHKIRKRPIYKYWSNSKLNNPEKLTKTKKQSSRQPEEQDNAIQNIDDRKRNRRVQKAEPKPSPTPKVTYEHLINLSNKKARKLRSRKQQQPSPPGAYTKFDPEPLDFSQRSIREQSSRRRKPKTEQMDVVDYGTYSNSDRPTPWPQSTGLDDDINNYLPDDGDQKSKGMYIPEETLATLKLTGFKRRRNSANNEDDDNEDNNRPSDLEESEESEKDNIDTGEDSPMFPVPVVVRGKNKDTGNPLSLSNLPRGYYVLMPLKKTEKMPVLPKVSLTEPDM